MPDDTKPDVPKQYLVCIPCRTLGSYYLFDVKGEDSVASLERRILEINRIERSPGLEPAFIHLYKVSKSYCFCFINCREYFVNPGPCLWY